MTKTLGIAFGGSGAEGIACIAYVKAMEELNIKPDIVSGTGIGAVVAAMYAAGMSSQDMTDFLKEVEFPGVKRPINISKVKDQKYGILDGMGLEEYFQMVVPIKVFDRLYFPLKIVAANYETGSEVVFSEGDVGRAVRCGVAIPGIFSPHEAEGVVYIDGSCVNPVPFDIIRDDCDILVCIDPGIDQTLKEQGSAPYVFPALMGAYSAAKRSLTIEKQKSCKVELYETVTVEDVTTFDFARYEDIIASLDEKTEKFTFKLKGLLK
ncbi:MAG: patatin-like phospholipase family protein [Eubacteriales bacterium]|nr:patatin-like phospholipase family protein [Eubacteriales bacterium]